MTHDAYAIDGSVPEPRDLVAGVEMDGNATAQGASA